MKVVKKYEMLQPKTGEAHRLFGVRFLYKHKMRDKKWTAADKMLQYFGLTRLYERDHALQKIAAIGERKEKQMLIHDLKIELKRKDQTLQNVAYGDIQRVKSMVQHDKYMSRAYPKWNSNMICERIDNFTFMKRKQLDCLKEEKRKFTEKYEARLLEIASFQDRIKYVDEIEPKEAEVIRKIEAELKNSETRLRATSSINRAYKNIIEIMLKDSIYYDSVLDALKDDLNEQDLFIQKTILLGKPAIDTAEKLEKQYSNLEQKTRKEMNVRIKDLLEYRKKIINNNERIRTFVRRDEDFEIDPTRYNRDTPNITELKEKLEKTGKFIKELKLATVTCEPLEIYPKMKEQMRRNTRILEQIQRKEKEKDLAIDLDLHADLIEQTLKYDLTDDEITKLGNIDSMKKQITDEKKKQQEFENKIKERSDNFVLIRVAFQHVLEVLNHIGKPLTVGSKKSRGSMMDLPLLKFDNVIQKYKPPAEVEQNIDTLLKVAKEKIDLVTNKYNVELEKEKNEYEKDIPHEHLKDAKTKEDDIELLRKLRIKQKNEEKIYKWKDYHHAIVNELTPGYKAKVADIEGKSFVEGWLADDPTVATRSQIKQRSAKIVQEMSKKDD